MAWYRIAFRPDVLKDLVHVESGMAQRLFDKTKWLASNVENLRHESLAAELPGLCKYAVGDWRIFYSLDRAEHLVEIHGIVPQQDLCR
jgi:mRNA interferase RelE/StbE